MMINSIVIGLFLLLMGCGQGDHQTYQGYVEGDNIYIASPNAGILDALAVHKGQYVKKGQLLFRLDADPQALVVEEAQANLKQAEYTLTDIKKPRRTPEIEAIKAQMAQIDARIQLSQIRVDRDSSLYKKKAIDKDSLDAAISVLTEQKNAKQELEENLKLALLGHRDEQILAQQALISAMKAKLAQAKWELDQKSRQAPADGIIFDTYYRQGEFVGAQQPVLSLLTPDNVHVEFFVPVEDLQKLRLGQKLSFKCFTCDDSETAIIDYISPEAQYVPPLVYSTENRDKIVFRIRAKLPDFNEYKPGEPVLVTR